MWQASKETYHMSQIVFFGKEPEVDSDLLTSLKGETGSNVWQYEYLSSEQGLMITSTQHMQKLKQPVGIFLHWAEKA